MKVFEYIIEFIIIGLLVLNFSLEINKEDEIIKNKIKVEVKGKVSSPGVYELDSDSRVIDQTTTIMIQKLKPLFVRKPLISKEI